MSPGEASSGEKTEQATPKKRRDARAEGQVAKSADAVIAVSMLTLLGALKVLGPFIVGNIFLLLERAFSWTIPAEVTIGELMVLFMDVMIHFLIIILPMLKPALASVAIYNLVK